VARLLSANHASPTLKDAMTILALSGMRVEELARMRVDDLRDLTGPLPYVQLRGTKTAAARVWARKARSPPGSRHRCRLIASVTKIASEPILDADRGAVL
jgi:hypothetical protein